jgi:transcriptional regulator with XRE-family HTH domain
VSTGAEHRDAGGHRAVGFGELVRSLRERALLTQEQLAERSGLNVRTIRRFETDVRAKRPQSASLRQLAAALGLDAAGQAVLVAAARGEPVPVGRRVPKGASPSMRQLPAPPPQFTGRDADLAALEAVRNQPGTVIVAIDGTAGIGKTALALHAAHRWSSEYPDGQIFLDLQGYTRGASAVEPGDALDRLLRSLGVPEVHVPDDRSDRAALYRSLLAGRRVLVLLDNAACEAQVGPLLPGAPGCIVIVTSRRRLGGLDLTYAHSLDLLPRDDAVRLLVHSCGERGVRGEPGERLTELAELCGRLPLAIRIAAARLRSRPSWTVAHFVDRLRNLQRRLVELQAGDRSVAAAIEQSYLRLGPDARRAYRMLGLHPGPELELDAAAALTGQPAVRVRRLIDHLLDVHLLHESAPGRYRFDDLTWAHAASAAGEEEAEADRRAAVSRLRDRDDREAGSDYADRASARSSADLRTVRR